MEGQAVHPCIELSEELRQSLTCRYDEQISFQSKAYPTHQHQVIFEHVSGIAEEAILSQLVSGDFPIDLQDFQLVVCT